MEESMIDNLSPTLAWTFAALAVPKQFTQIVQDSILKVNENCKKTVNEIEK